MKILLLLAISLAAVAAQDFSTIFFSVSQARRSFSATRGFTPIITFNRLHANLGRGYDHASGIFTAPTSGYYEFHWSALCTRTSHGLCRIALVKDGRQVVHSWGTAGQPGGIRYSNSASNSIIIAMRHGDTAYLELTRGGIYEFPGGAGSTYTTFTGKLLAISGGDVFQTEPAVFNTPTQDEGTGTGEGDISPGDAGTGTGAGDDFPGFQRSETIPTTSNDGSQDGNV